MCELQENQRSQRGIQQSCMVQAAFSSIKKLEAGIKDTFSVYLRCLWSMDYLEVTHK